MLNPMCPLCTYDDTVDVIETLSDGRKRCFCRSCKFDFVAGERAESTTEKPTSSIILRGRFPKAEDVTPEARERANRLKREFLTAVHAEPEANVAPYWARYQQIFSAEGLAACDPQDLKDFANNGVGGAIGNMSVFNNAWNALGAEKAAADTRKVIEYLLRGDGDLETRLTQLIAGQFPFSIQGFKESCLSKVLAIVYPDRFLTIHTYAQKATMALEVYGVALPSPDSVNWTIGRLIVWSNDLLNDLLGDGFADQQHAGAFLWWAQNQP